MAKGAEFYQVIAAFSTTINGYEVEYQAGEIVEAGDPGIKRAPDHFGPVVIKQRLDRKPVEQATAAPGEQRGKAMTVAAMQGRS